MEIQDCLQELFQDDRTEEDGVHCNYFDLVASKSQESSLCFHGVKILPPLLSGVEKNAMREYRRKAVELEKIILENRRQKYSNLVLKVMDVMDRLQRKAELSKVRTSSFSNQKGNPYKNQELQGKENVQEQEGMKTLRETNQEKTYESMKIMKEDIGNNNDNNSLLKEWTFKESQNIDNDLPDSSSIFQKPKLYNSSSSPRRNKDDSTKTSEQNDISPNNINESNGDRGQVTQLILERESLASRSGTLIRDSNLPRESLDDGKEINAGDSLASTVLSIAFTDSSVASQFSTMEGTLQSTKPVQCQLNMESINDNLYQSYQHNVKLITSTPIDLQRPVTGSGQKAKKNPPVKHAALSSQKETYTEQDRALEKLEMMRKKLLQEKEKQIALLRQQELARLRRNQDKQKLFDLSEELYIHSDERFSQEHFASYPASDIYSIPERSFEGSSITLTGDDQYEAESASDKENNHYRYNPPQRVYHDVNSAVHFKGNTVGYASPSMRDTGDDTFRPSLYMRQEFLKQFEFIKSQGCNGKDRFSLLTAHSKGFITRRLLQAQKVQIIIKTIKDTREFLADISKEGASSYQDKSLQQRVQAQMVAAKTKLHNIFFKIPVQDRMAYIAHSRNIAKEKEERQYNKSKKSTRRLSSATLKAMQRRNGGQIEKSELKRTTSQSPLMKKRNLDTRVLKPVQSSKSPQLQEKTRLVGRRRPGTASSPRHSIIKKNTYNSRPATAVATRPSNRKSISRRSVESENTSTRKPPRISLEGRLLAVAKQVKPNEEKANSKLPVRKSLGGGLTYRVAKVEEENVKQQSSRPSRLSLEGTRQVIRQDTANTIRPKTTTSVTRRTTRSMAAKFNKS